MIDDPEWPANLPAGSQCSSSFDNGRLYLAVVLGLFSRHVLDTLINKVI